MNDFCRELCKILWKKNVTWIIRRLVDDSLVPSARLTSVLNCKLTDLKFFFPSKYSHALSRFVLSVVFTGAFQVVLFKGPLVWTKCLLVLLIMHLKNCSKLRWYVQSFFSIILSLIAGFCVWKFHSLINCYFSHHL